MPTTLPRVLITRTPQVEQILAAGRARWPERPASATLVALASEAVAARPRSDYLPAFESPQPLTAEILQAALDEN
ncbi:MAG: hypothetical protein FWD83_00100 [Promicromonosporaceae bacterium]|nr:hypothetical protein [Promicromonosporaceae bacterium]